MGIPYIPGIDQQLAPAIQMFAQGLNHAINPNYALQEHMKELMAQNPELIQKLADVEKETPGTLDKLGFGKVGQTIGATPQSEESKFRMDNGPAILDSMKQHLEAQTQQARFTAEDFKGYAEFLKANPGAKVEDYLKRATGETRGQRADDQVAETMAARKLQWLAKVPNLGDVDLVSMARKMQHGQLKGDEFAALMSDPATGAAFSQAIAQVHHDDQLAAERARIAQMGTGRSNFMEAQAFKMYDQSQVGGPEAWKSYLFDPGARDKAAALATKPLTDLTPEERSLVEVYKADKSMRFSEMLKQSHMYNQSITNSITTIGKMQDAGDMQGVGPELQALNEVLKAREGATGQKIEAKFGKIPDSGMFWDSKGLYFVDDKGKKVDPTTVTGTLVQPPEVPNATVMRYWSVYSGKKTAAEKQAVLDMVKANDPAGYVELQKRINGGK